MADGNGRETPVPIAVFRLRTGYEVPVMPENLISEDVEHLVNALLGEVMLAAAKQGDSWEAGMDALAEEVTRCVVALTDAEKDALLLDMIWHYLRERWKQLEKRVPKGT